MKYKAIIFDMDGTIIDTEGIWEAAIAQLLKKREVSLAEHEWHLLMKQTLGLHLKPTCSLFKEQLSLPDSVDDLIHELTQLANTSYEEKVCFIEGFPEFHAQTKTHMLRTAIATNAVESSVHITQKKLNLDHFFGDHIYNISHVNYVGKPHPAIYLYAADKLQVDPTKCIAIEDSAHGVTAAKAAGMHVIGINTAKKPDLLKHADMIIDGYHEIDLHDLLQVKK